jgi:hypothetical protein
MAPVLYARQQALKTVTGLSPTGGINSVAALSAMQPDEAVQMENLWPGAGGAQSRLGSTVHTENVGYIQATSTFTPPTSATATCVINGVSFTATFTTNADTTVTNLIALIHASAPVSALVTVTLVSHKMVVTAKALGSSGNGITTTSNAANGASFNHATTQDGLSSTLGNYTVIPFHGEDGTKNKLFVATNQGIFDCTVTGAAPTLAIAFASPAGLAGIGSSTNYSSVGDHFCVYCDEVNGYYLYTESSTSWQRVGSGTPSISVFTPPNAATATCVINGTTYVSTFDTDAGTTIVNLMAVIRSDPLTSALVTLSSNGTLMTVTAVEPGTGGNGITTTTDGANGAAFSAIATAGGTDGVYGVDPHDFVFPCVWMRRLWFCERGSSTGWFLPFDSVFGQAKPFNFGASQAAGGALKCMANWTVDSGAGVGNNLVIISEAGNVSVYGGTDPEVFGQFQLSGVWFIGGTPNGRNITTGDGGDVLVATVLGVMSLAHYLQGLSLADRSLYATKNIQNIVADEVQRNGTLEGWQLVVTPDEQAIILTVPQQQGDPVCYGAPYATRNWCKLTGRPSASMGVWLNKLYFVQAGTQSNLMEVTGSLDDVQLDGSGAQPIPWTVFGSFQGYGTPSVRKRVQMIRPYFTTTGNPVNYSVVPRYDYDLTAPPPATTPPIIPAGALWDVALWDVALWSTGTTSLVPYSQLIGAFGQGHVVAVAMTGFATEPTTLIQVDILYEEGSYW